MNQYSLNTLAHQLAAQLAFTQELLCRQIIHTIAEFGQPIAPASLATHLQMSDNELQTRLARIPDTEFDEQGNIVGWGITLLPTQHQFFLQEYPLFTWCAFDTVLFPPLLQTKAQVQSICSTSGQTITFVSTPTGITDLFPATSMLSLTLPTEQCKHVRGTFCHQSLFFQSGEAAEPWLRSHPEATLLTIEDAATIGHIIAREWPYEETVRT